MNAVRGGPEVGARTLSTFFVLHIALLPILLALLVSFHFWLVRKSGGVMLPQRPGEARPKRTLVPASPHLVYREALRRWCCSRSCSSCRRSSMPRCRSRPTRA